MTEPSHQLPDDPDPDFTPQDPAARMDPPFSLSALIKLGIASMVVIGASFAGQIATMKGLSPWYFALTKPPLTPPPVVFPIVWTLLYVLMAWVLWRLLRLRETVSGRTQALIAFGIQLGLNILWSWAFFAANSPLAGLFVILALNIAIWRMIGSVARVDRSAAASQLPYAAWVGFASYLTAGLWWVN